MQATIAGAYLSLLESSSCSLVSNNLTHFFNSISRTPSTVAGALPGHQLVGKQWRSSYWMGRASVLIFRPLIRRGLHRRLSGAVEEERSKAQTLANSGRSVESAQIQVLSH
jgi:hypothetical protein